MVVFKAAPAAHQLYPCFLNKAEVQLIEPIYLSAHIGQQGARVAVNPLDFPAIAGCIGKQMFVSGAINQQLFGHAAADHAGATHPIALHDRHPGAIACGPFGSS